MSSFHFTCSTAIDSSIVHATYLDNTIYFIDSRGFLKSYSLINHSLDFSGRTASNIFTFRNHVFLVSSGMITRLTGSDQFLYNPTMEIPGDVAEVKVYTDGVLLLGSSDTCWILNRNYEIHEFSACVLCDFSPYCRDEAFILSSNFRLLHTTNILLCHNEPLREVLSIPGARNIYTLNDLYLVVLTDTELIKYKILRIGKNVTLSKIYSLKCTCCVTYLVRDLFAINGSVVSLGEVPVTLYTPPKCMTGSLAFVLTDSSFLISNKIVTFSMQSPERIFSEMNGEFSLTNEKFSVDNKILNMIEEIVNEDAQIEEGLSTKFDKFVDLNLLSRENKTALSALFKKSSAVEKLKGNLDLLISEILAKQNVQAKQKDLLRTRIEVLNRRLALIRERLKNIYGRAENSLKVDASEFYMKMAELNKLMDEVKEQSSVNEDIIKRMKLQRILLREMLVREINK